MSMSMVPAKSSSSGSFPTVGLAGVVIVLAALAVYYNSLSCPLIFDDWPAITENPTIRHLWSALSPPHNGSGVDGRPLINLSFAMNYAVGGLKVWGYHATNLAIHILAGLVLFGIVRRTLLRPSFAKATEGGQGYGGQALLRLDSATVLAFAIALLWTVHPLQTESVTSVIQRTESLMGLFYLLTLYCFIRGTENREQRSEARDQRSEERNNRQEAGGQKSEDEIQEQTGIWPLASGCWMPASVLSCLLGMAAKEVMVSAPLIVLLYDRTFLAGTFREAWRRRGGWHLGLFGTWLMLGFILVRMGGSRGHAAGFGLSLTPWAYALTQCRAIVLYLKLTVWPHPLVFDYGTDAVQHVAAVVPQAFVLTLLLGGTIVMLRYRPAIGFAGAWFFAILAPSSSVVPLVGQTMAEHRMYLPLAAVLALMVIGLYVWLGRRSLIILAAAAAGLGWLTLQRNQDYRSDLAIWSDTVAKRPGNARAYSNLGGALAGTPGRLPEAISAFEEVLRIQPNDPGALNNLACILVNIPGRLPEAIGHFETALRIAPGYVKARNNLGIVLYKTGRTSEAIVQLKEAVRIDPDDAEARYNLALALDKIGRLPEAIIQLEEVVRINPDDAEAHINLGIALDKAGQMPEAIVQFERAVRIDADDATAHKNLGIALGKIGRISEAIAQCQEVLRINPDSADARAFLEKLQKAAKQGPE
jgi:tetratricopeptide (TPR) repeat protein